MPGVQMRSFDSPDETRSPDKTKVDVVRMGDTTAGRFAFEPGWKWSDCVKPVAGTDSCQLRHVGVVGSGSLVGKHEDGTEVELSAGDADVIEPGPGARVSGDEQFVGYEFESRAAAAYAQECWLGSTARINWQAEARAWRCARVLAQRAGLR